MREQAHRRGRPGLSPNTPQVIVFNVGADLLRESFRGMNPLSHGRCHVGRYAANVTYIRIFDVANKRICRTEREPRKAGPVALN